MISGFVKKESNGRKERWGNRKKEQNGTRRSGSSDGNKGFQKARLDF